MHICTSRFAFVTDKLVRRMVVVSVGVGTPESLEAGKGGDWV